MAACWRSGLRSNPPNHDGSMVRSLCVRDVVDICRFGGDRGMDIGPFIWFFGWQGEELLVAGC